MVKADGTCWCSIKKTDSCTLTNTSSDTRQYNFLKICKRDFPLTDGAPEEWTGKTYGKDREDCVHTKTCSEFVCQGIYKDKSKKSGLTGFSSIACCDPKKCDEDTEQICNAEEGYILKDDASGTRQSEPIEGVSNCCREMKCVGDVTSANLAAYVRKTDGGSCSDNTSTTKAECESGGFAWTDAYVKHGKNLNECYELKKCNTGSLVCDSNTQNPTGRDTVRETSTEVSAQKNDCCTKWDKFNQVTTPQKLNNQFEGFIDGERKFVRFKPSKTGYKCTGIQQRSIGGMLLSGSSNRTDKIRDHCAKTCAVLNSRGFSTGGADGGCECLTGSSSNCEADSGWNSYDFTLNTDVDCSQCADEDQICEAEFDCSQVCSGDYLEQKWKQCQKQMRGFFRDHTCNDVSTCPAKGVCSNKLYTTEPACFNKGKWTSTPTDAFKIDTNLNGSTAEACCVKKKCKDVSCGAGQKPSNNVEGYNQEICCVEKDIWDLASEVQRIENDTTTTDFIVEKTVDASNQSIDKTCNEHSDCHAYFSCANMDGEKKCYKDAIIPGNSCMNWSDVSNSDFKNPEGWNDQICRNINNEKNRPWCYISNNTWSYC